MFVYYIRMNYKNITPVNVMENSINDMFKIDMESINKKLILK